MTHTGSKTQVMIYTAMFAAVMCVLGPISLSIPISPVPISLSVFAILISAYALGKWYGIASLMIYLLIGFVGVPVFSKFTGGPGVLMGPTGGYVIGYVFIALFTGLFVEKSDKRYMHALGMIIGVAICYAFGTLWLAKVAGIGLKNALFAGVVPFIPADAVKIAAALAVGPKLRKMTGLHS